MCVNFENITLDESLKDTINRVLLAQIPRYGHLFKIDSKYAE
jgi:hypothetical protein